MKIADLYAALKLHVDNATFKRGDDKLKALGEKIAKLGKSANKAFGRGLNYAAAGVAGALTLGAKEALAFDKSLTALYLSSNKTMGTQAEMRDAFLELSRTSGLAKESLVEAAASYVALTGDGKGAVKSIETFGRVAKASGSSIEDVAGAAAALNLQFGIMPDGMEHAFDILIAGGKAGAVELKNMQTLLPSLGAKFKEFKNATGEGGLTTLGALFQVEARDTKNAEEAAVNLENLFAKIKTRKGELAKIGVKVEDGKTGSGQYKDIIEIIDLLGKAKDKNFEAFGEAFGNDMQATAALDTLRKNIPAVKELIELTAKSKAVREDLAVVEKSAAARAERAWNDVKLALARAFTPERVEQLANVLTRLAGIITTVIDKIGGVENAVWLMIGAWTVFKGIQIAGLLIPIVTQLLAMAAAGNMAAGSALNAMGALGKLGALGASFGAGYGVGTWLSHKLGLNEGDEGYNDDYADPNDPNAKKRAERARRRRLGLPAVDAIANPTASVPTPAGVAGGGGATLTQHTEINVTSTAADPAQVAREVQRAQEAVNRDAAASLAGGG